MKYYSCKINNSFIGRQAELAKLKSIFELKEASIIALIGRRRVGKTELIEHFCYKKKVWKFEGLQFDVPKTEQESDNRRQAQIALCVQRLGEYLEQENIFKNVKCNTWTDFFNLINPYAKSDELILYFEEIQWLSNYQADFLARLKPFWDDKWRHNKKLRIIFAGSSPSFIIQQFSAKSAMYNRTNYLITLNPFTHFESREFLKNKGLSEIMLAILAIGGVPGYLKRIKNGSSILQNICTEAFTKDGYFFNEYENVFVSSMSGNPYYKKIIEYLAKYKYANRAEITKAIYKKETSGGHLTELLQDLESCGFIKSYTSLHLLKGRNLTRYTISDEFLNFYFNFIKPIENKIKNGDFEVSPLTAINKKKLDINLGFMFERWCLKNHNIIAKILNFAAVDYTVGSYFSKNINQQISGFQIDLMFIRKDYKIIIAEIKYLETILPAKIVKEMEEKITLFIENNPKYKNYTFERLLICKEVNIKNPDILTKFDHVIQLSDLFREIWVQ